MIRGAQPFFEDGRAFVEIGNLIERSNLNPDLRVTAPVSGS